MLRRSGVAPTQMRDWAGTVSADVLRRMRGDPELSELCNVLGRHTSQYTAQLLECATADTEILNVGLDLTIWNRRKSGKRMAEQGTFSFPLSMSLSVYRETAADRQSRSADQLGDQGVHDSRVGERVVRVRERPLLRDEALARDGEVICNTTTAICDEGVRATTTVSYAHTFATCNSYGAVCFALAVDSDVCHIYLLLTLSTSDLEELAHLTEATQAELVRWVFTNEDKVWRARGGRPGEETLAQFLALLQPHKGHPCVPGIVCFFQRTASSHICFITFTLVAALCQRHLSLLSSLDRM